MSINKRFKEFAQENAGAIRRTVKAITEAKGKWMREVMRAHLPKETFEMADSHNAQDLIALRDYLVAHSIQEKLLPDNSVQVVRGEEVLGTFKVEFKEGQIAIDAKVSVNNHQLRKSTNES